MSTQPKHKKYTDHVTKKVFRDDDVAMMGRKGGKVQRERREARAIDLELRHYTYR